MKVISMEIRISHMEGSDIAIVEAPEVIIRDAQDALDLMASITYTHGCTKAVLDKANISEDFFRLSTGLAGEILQKFSNYRFVVAIVGDFNVYDSKSLRDFIYECNQGKQVFFAKDKQSALDHLRNL
jgi:hypothetical protein